MQAVEVAVTFAVAEATVKAVDRIHTLTQLKETQMQRHPMVKVFQRPDTAGP